MYTPLVLFFVVLTVLFSCIALVMNLKQNEMIRKLDASLLSTMTEVDNLKGRVVNYATSLGNAHAQLQALQHDMQKASNEDPVEVNWPLQGDESENTLRLREQYLTRAKYVSKGKEHAMERTRKIAEKYPHYYMGVRGLEYVDVYRILDGFGVKDPNIQHAVKKLMACGGRGAKDFRKDLQEAIDTLERRLVILDENNIE